MAQVLKTLSEQVMVITGATSGIGLVTARRAAQRGARLVLSSRNEGALRQLSDELNRQGASTCYVAADVGKAADIHQIAQKAIDQFGGFDTWVNNAGVTIFTHLEDAPMDDYRRMFDTNFWGTVQGSLTALKHLRQRGGAIINVGSVASDVAIPLQTMYAASKHAIKGFTDGLRGEIDSEGAPVSVTLIKPGSIDTLFVEHSKNYLPEEPTLPSPLYAPEAVADAILFAAEHPKRDIYVGGTARVGSALSRLMPRTIDWLGGKAGPKAQSTGHRREQQGRNALYHHDRDLQERQDLGKRVRESSLYTKAVTDRRDLSLFLLGASAVLIAAYRYRHKRNLERLPTDQPVYQPRLRKPHEVAQAGFA